MSDIIDRLKERCFPPDQRDELCMDAVYVITDLREKLAEAESLLSGLDYADMDAEQEAAIRAFLTPVSVKKETWPLDRDECARLGRTY